MRYNYNEPVKLAVFRSRDLDSKYVNSHKEVVALGYVHSLDEFDSYVKMEYPNARRVESTSHRGTGAYYFTDDSYNIFYHEMPKLNTLEDLRHAKLEDILEEN